MFLMASDISVLSSLSCLVIFAILQELLVRYEFSLLEADCAFEDERFQLFVIFNLVLFFEFIANFFVGVQLFLHALDALLSCDQQLYELLFAELTQQRQPSSSRARLRVVTASV